MATKVKIKNVPRAIASRIGKISPHSTYTPQRIIELGLILDSNGNPAPRTLYRRLKAGVIPAITQGNKDKPRYIIKGSALISYLQKEYNLEE
jgi:hypothetical protein